MHTLVIGTKRQIILYKEEIEFRKELGAKPKPIIYYTIDALRQGSIKSLSIDGLVLLSTPKQIHTELRDKPFMNLVKTLKKGLKVNSKLLPNEFLDYLNENVDSADNDSNKYDKI
jgi:hypothetical protein